RYENLLYTMELSGREIKDYLEYSYSQWFNTIGDEEDHLLRFEKDDEGELVFSQRSNSPMLKNRYYNFDSAEGLFYTVDVSKPAGERIIITKLDDGTKFDLGRMYKVAINSYRGNGGGGHLVKGSKIPKNDLSKRILVSTEKDLRYYMMKWIEEQKTVSPVQIINWSIIPEAIVDKAKKRDYRLMFESKN
ncbi:MAG: 5'-nucleotidase C-terminal domain-containing protein, partial [Melioribacteraceae bacterium]|nr:5'-nucleotidase C-terminal domain-containing protein [Melioribacteraceae bacterium]